MARLLAVKREKGRKEKGERRKESADGPPTGGEKGKRRKEKGKRNRKPGLHYKCNTLEPGGNYQ